MHDQRAYSFLGFFAFDGTVYLGSISFKMYTTSFLVVQSGAFGEDFFHAYKPCQSLMYLFVFFHTT